MVLWRWPQLWKKNHSFLVVLAVIDLCGILFFFYFHLFQLKFCNKITSNEWAGKQQTYWIIVQPLERQHGKIFELLWSQSDFISFSNLFILIQSFTGADYTMFVEFLTLHLMPRSFELVHREPRSSKESVLLWGCLCNFAIRTWINNCTILL